MKIQHAAAILIQAMALMSLSLAQQSSPLADPEAERILDKAAQAEGGENVLGTLRTLRVTGSAYGGASSRRLGDFESIVKFPDKFRDTSMSAADGTTLTYCFDGTEAWKRQTGGERSTGLPRIQLLLPAAQWRLRYREAKFVGQRKVGNYQTYVVRALVRGQISPADYYYDPVNYLLLQVDSASATEPYHLSQFHDIGGLKVPRELSYGDGRIVIDSIKINIDIDDKQFAKPK
jgi:hypothetical protein